MSAVMRIRFGVALGLAAAATLAFGAQTLTPPNVTVDDRMTLYRGDREIRLLYLGRGHTAGDLVVYLPKERVLCSGDLLVNGLANLIDGFVDEWPLRSKN